MLFLLKLNFWGLVSFKGKPSRVRATLLSGDVVAKSLKTRSAYSRKACLRCAASVQERPQEILVTSVSPEVLSGSPANRLITGWQSANIPARDCRFRVAPLGSGPRRPYGLWG